MVSVLKKFQAMDIILLNLKFIPDVPVYTYLHNMDLYIYK